MPIRFQCDSCSQRLSISRRKAGVEITCPTCGRAQRVPSENGDSAMIELVVEETAPKEAADSLAAESPPVGMPPEELESGRAPSDAVAEPAEVPVDTPSSETIEPPLPASPIAPLPHPPPAPRPAGSPPSVDHARRPFPWAILVQALLLAVMGIGGFAAGYHLGVQDSRLSASSASTPEAQAKVETDDGFRDQEVLFQGRLTWMPTVGETAGDAGSVMILLPANRIPDRSLPIAGLAPAADSSAETSRSVGPIERFGGVHARADADGTVAAVIPREGEYFLLLISRNTTRPEGQRLADRDLVDLKQYFAEPEDLIGRRKYACLKKEIRVGFAPLNHDFGLDGLP